MSGNVLQMRQPCLRMAVAVVAVAVAVAVVDAARNHSLLILLLLVLILSKTQRRCCVVWSGRSVTDLVPVESCHLSLILTKIFPWSIPMPTSVVQRFFLCGQVCKSVEASLGVDTAWNGGGQGCVWYVAIFRSSFDRCSPCKLWAEQGHFGIYRSTAGCWWDGCSWDGSWTWQCRAQGNDSQAWLCTSWGMLWIFAVPLAHSDFAATNYTH